MDKFQKSVVVIVLFSIIAQVIGSCGKKSCIDAPDVSNVEIEVSIERLDKKLHKIPTKEELSALLDSNPVFAESFLHISEYLIPEIIVARYHDLLNASDIDSLFYEVDKTFGDMEDIRLQFEDAFRYLKYYYPDFKVPKIQTVVTGIANDLYITDSVIVIGLDYYLGPKGKYQPKGMPDYLLNRYQKEYMVPQIILLYSNYFNDTDMKDKTALADMVFYGKAYFMAKNLMPCTPDSLFTGYSSFESGDIVEHEQVIWAGLLENQALYETSPFIKDKFLSERPKTIEIGENCPGRIGRWVGWQIVRKYAKQHPELSLPDIMRNTDAQKIFNESKYKPIAY
ncbi:MAG: gliding motility lipoprotein GldB [Cyclobacteriaceae bacterium]|nr:gliding motility lipoprotein GldB [Cyclobacteriaceae bacterium]